MTAWIEPRVIERERRVATAYGDAYYSKDLKRRIEPEPMVTDDAIEERRRRLRGDADAFRA
jgi:hypothetical protein